MRIAITTNHRRVVGGVQTYLQQLIPALLANGHEVAFWYELDAAPERTLVAPEKIPQWGVDTLGAEAALKALKDWRPDVFYSHGVSSPELEAQLLEIAPGVIFLHDYQGACISGSKTHRWPSPIPCDKPFGAACLLHYFPRRCGGLSPVTMLREYQRQQHRAKLLQRYRLLLTHSDYMVREYQRYGFTSAQLRSIPFPVTAPVELEPTDFVRPATDEVRLLFLGRMELLKGGHYFIEALPELARRMNRPIVATLAGDGAERVAWEQRAALVQNSRIKIRFPGWVNAREKNNLLLRHDLLVVPSLWPEPFGMTGIEAGYYGVPAAAFQVGGVATWLKEGVNGHLAPGDPPRPDGLAQALVKCLKSEEHYRALKQGSREQAQRFSAAAHVKELERLLAEVCAKR